MKMSTGGVARSAQDVIDAAVSDNLWWEKLCFGIVIVCVAVGTAGTIFGIMRGDVLASVSGAGFTALFWPALRYAIAIKRDNQRIRMYEYALALATSAKEATNILRDAVGVASPE